MKLKLFGKKGDEAAEPANDPAAPAAEQEVISNETDEPTEETPEEEAPEASTEEAPEEAPAEEEATLADVIGQINACTEQIVNLKAENADLKAKIKDLTGDRTEDIEQAAAEKAVTITASQGVPVAELPESESEEAIDEPKTLAEFQTAYNAIEGAAERGAFYQKYSTKFFG